MLKSIRQTYRQTPSTFGKGEVSGLNKDKGWILPDLFSQQTLGTSAKGQWAWLDVQSPRELLSYTKVMRA